MTKSKHTTHLNHSDHSIRIEGWIENSSKMLTKNYYGDYEFTFRPHTSSDRDKLFEAAQTALAEVEQECRYEQSYKPRLKIQDSVGDVLCSQKYEPKINEEVINPLQLSGRKATLSLSFRDAGGGNIYCICDYIDLYDVDNGFIDYRYPAEPGEKVCEFAW